MKQSQSNDNGFIDYSYQGFVAGNNTYLSMAPPSPLNRWVQCFWQLNVPKGRYVYRVVPDNNVDCIFTLNKPEENFVVSPFHSPLLFQINGPISYFGIRFRVLAQQLFTAIPIGEWGNAGLSDIFGVNLMDRIFESIEIGHEFQARCDITGKVLQQTLHYRIIDKRLTKFVQYAHQYTSSKIDLSEKQCSEFALSARHLRRLCQLYLGLSPRNFNRVLRFQKTLHLMNTSNISSAWANYYYDQPHFVRDFKALAGLTPSEFTNSSVLYNVSDDSM